MSDDPTRRGSQDRTRVNVNQDHELRYWTKKWGVTAEQLKEAVRQVGDHTEKVEELLKGKSAGSSSAARHAPRPMT